MKAIVFTKYGSPDVLELKEVARPNPKDDEVLIRVHAASLNDWDWGALHGVPFVNRLIFGLLSPKKQILGSDIAGRIEAVGKNVLHFQPGDAVFGDLSGEWGGFAEYVCARENALALKPPSMTFEEAAAIPQAAMLALQGLRDTGRIQPGQKLLINGAGGGVGTFAIQIAKLYGAEVTGVDSPEKLDVLRSMGAEHVIDYTEQDFTRNGQRYDLILDVKTNRSILDCARALSPNGVYVTVGGSMPRLFQALLLSPWISMTTNKRVGIVSLKPNKDLAYLKELFEAGKMKPVIDGPYRLRDVPNAFRRFGEGRHKGKVVITLEQSGGRDDH
ncbi:MAG: NAD(P)-dependent alcohol dehydrogenase [Nitrospiraceae bacterium]|nr:NAD(P)-dependent alcohol dehydrogenase [Nitrospiraceae bacterium]